MEITLKQTISEKLASFIKTHNITQGVISKKTKVREEYISSILKGVFTYNAGSKKVGDIPQKYFYQIAEFIGYSIKKKYWVYKNTSQLTTAIAILEEAREFGYTRVIIGKTGSGKTTSVSLYERNNPSDLYVVKVGSEDNLNDLLDKVAESLNLRVGRNKSRKIRDITNRLRDLYDAGRKPQLIFDECEYMKQPALCSIKEFFDYLIERCSLVLVGTPQFIQQIEALRRKNKKGIPQLYRRIKFGIRYLPEINRSYDKFLTDIEDKGLKKYLQLECENYGELHDVLLPCLREADRLDVPLDIDLVEKVLNIKIPDRFKNI